jgi:hypothetical protein
MIYWLASMEQYYYIIKNLKKVIQYSVSNNKSSDTGSGVLVREEMKNKLKFDVLHEMAAATI